MRIKCLAFNLFFIRAGYGSVLQAFENLALRQVTLSSVSRSTHLSSAALTVTEESRWPWTERLNYTNSATASQYDTRQSIQLPNLEKWDSNYFICGKQRLSEIQPVKKS